MEWAEYLEEYLCTMWQESTSGGGQEGPPHDSVIKEGSLRMDDLSGTEGRILSQA